ncbi:hypothetical protein Drorol1_Dr00021629 [Drosera rotundifolia]
MVNGDGFGVGRVISAAAEAMDFDGEDRRWVVLWRTNGGKCSSVILKTSSARYLSTCLLGILDQCQPGILLVARPVHATKLARLPGQSPPALSAVNRLPSTENRVIVVASSKQNTPPPKGPSPALLGTLMINSRNSSRSTISS